MTVSCIEKFPYRKFYLKFIKIDPLGVSVPQGIFFGVWGEQYYKSIKFYEEICYF